MGAATFVIVSISKLPFAADSILYDSYLFECQEPSGAILACRSPVSLHGLRGRISIIRYMKEHIDRWIEHIAKQDDSCNPTDIVFVSQTLKTSWYFAAAFDEAPPHAILSYSRQPDPSSPHFLCQIALDGAPVPDHCKMHQGSTDDHGNPRRDLCIFMHYFKMRKRSEVPQDLKASAGTNVLPPDDGDDPDSEHSDHQDRDRRARVSCRVGRPAYTY